LQQGVSRQSLWKGLDLIGMVESHRELDRRTSRECRFYIGSISTNAKQLAYAVRTQWAIENSLH